MISGEGEVARMTGMPGTTILGSGETGILSMAGARLAGLSAATCAVDGFKVGGVEKCRTEDNGSGGSLLSVAFDVTFAG